MFGNDNAFDFSSISLSGVQAATAGSVLPPGEYVCTTKNAKVGDTKAKDGKILTVLLVNEASDGGAITARMNLKNKSAEATRIGLGELKAMLVHGGHPSPDDPGDLESLNGLRVGVRVGSETYEGQARSVVKGFLDPSKVKTSPAAAPKSLGAASFGGDDIPF